MPQQPSTKSVREAQSEPQQTTLLTKRETIVMYLTSLALPSVFNRTLSEKDFDVWEALLQGFSKEAISYAFDNYGRNGNSFPRPKLITDLCKVYATEQVDDFKPCSLCNDGWLLEDYIGKLGKKYRGARRCQCWNEYIARKKASA